MEILIPAAIVGAISSFIVELFKFIPALAKTDLRKQITAFTITLLIVSGYVFFSEGVAVGWIGFLGFFVLSLSTAYGVFKTTWKGLRTTLGFKN